MSETPQLVACPWCLSRGLICYHDPLPPRPEPIHLPTLEKAIQVVKALPTHRDYWDEEPVIELEAVLAALDALRPTPEERTK